MLPYNLCVERTKGFLKVEGMVSGIWDGSVSASALLMNLCQKSTEGKGNAKVRRLETGDGWILKRKAIQPLLLS